MRSLSKCFASTVTAETYIINHKFNCNDKCLVYLLICNCCKKQYLDQTVDEFLFGWNSYKSNCRKHQPGETCMGQHLYEHFCSSNYNCFISDVSVTRKTDPSDPLKREDYWRQWLPLVLILKKVREDLCYSYPSCIALGAAMLGDKKFF